MHSPYLLTRCLAGVALLTLFFVTILERHHPKLGFTFHTRTRSFKSGRKATRSTTDAVPHECDAVTLSDGAHKFLFRHATLERPTSYPFFTGDTVRSFADHVYDETTDVATWTGRAASVQHGDILFLKTDFMARFFEVVFPLIQHSFVLATHNSDYSAPAGFAESLDDPKLFAWYAVNPDAVHPKLTPMPIGFANAHWPSGSTTNLHDAFDAARVNPWKTRKHGVYVNIEVENNKAKRCGALQQAASLKGAHSPGRANFSDYLTDVANSKFVLSPPGNGIDCHRTWEAVLMGAVPIVESSLLNPLYRGLPVAVVQHWSDLTEEFLATIAAQGVLDRHCVPTVLRADYWLARMLAHRASPSVSD